MASSDASDAEELVVNDTIALDTPTSSACPPVNSMPVKAQLKMKSVIYTAFLS